MPGPRPAGRGAVPAEPGGRSSPGRCGARSTPPGPCSSSALLVALSAHRFAIAGGAGRAGRAGQAAVRPGRCSRSPSSPSSAGAQGAGLRPLGLARWVGRVADLRACWPAPLRLDPRGVWFEQLSGTRRSSTSRDLARCPQPVGPAGRLRGPRRRPARRDRRRPAAGRPGRRRCCPSGGGTTWPPCWRSERCSRSRSTSCPPASTSATSSRRWRSLAPFAAVIAPAWSPTWPVAGLRRFAAPSPGPDQPASASFPSSTPCWPRTLMIWVIGLTPDRLGARRSSG